MEIKLSKINSILVNAFLIRIAMLICIVLLADVLPAYGFMGNSVSYDDYRYEQGAIEYAHSADGIIDLPAFTKIFDSMRDNTGHHTSSLYDFFSWSTLWYWIVCILAYITKWRWSIRILNILLVTLSIKYIYRLTQYIYGKRTALMAAKLMAYLPYTVVFSCFSYKDCFVMFCTFYLWYFFIKKKYVNINTTGERFGCVICTLLLFLTRSGLSVVLISMLLVFSYFDEIVAIVKSKRSKKTTLAIAMLSLVLASLMIYLFREPLGRKITGYILDTSGYENLGFGGFVKPRNIRDVWKLPFTLVFAIMQPIGFSEKIGSWTDIISFVNVIMCPIAVGFFLYLIQKKKTDKTCFWFMTAYYMVTAVASVLIFRQLFSVLPIPIIGFADFMTRSGLRRKKSWMALSIFLTTLVIIALALNTFA